MSHRRSRLIAAAVLGACILAVLLASCSEKASGTRKPNIPPDTFIAYGPSEDSLTYYKVQVFWYGADDDGSIDHFLVNTVEDVDRTSYEPGFDWDSLDGWTATTSKESTFVFSADSCCIDVGSVRAASALWGVLVRAVDNDGGVSEEPAMLFFQATNVLPSVTITVPDMPAGVRPSLTKHPYYEWEGDDPDGDLGALQYKYILIPDSDGDPLTPQTFPALSEEGGGEGGSHASPPVGKWSQWVPTDCTSVRDADLELYSPRPGEPLTYMWFALAAKDEGEAILPSTRYAKICGVVIGVGAGVRIYVDGGQLGLRDSKGNTDDKVSGLFTGTDVSFRIYCQEIRSQGSLAEAFRYYWDSSTDPTSLWNFWTGVEPLRESGRTPEWLVRYPSDGSTFEPTLGKHIFYVEVRDVNRTTTHCLFRLEVLPGPGVLTERKILYVDDNTAQWLPNVWLPFQTSEDALWDDILEGFPVEKINTGKSHKDRKVDIRQVNTATTVIWNVDYAQVSEEVNQLLDLCAQDPDLDLAAGGGNYLYSYVKVGGNLIIVGMDPVYTTMFWPDGRMWSGSNMGGSDMRFPIDQPSQRTNFTSWDFTPLAPTVSETGDSVFNWMWDLFGIETMEFPLTPVKPLSALISCDDCDPAFRDSIHTIESPTRQFSGVFGNAAYITRLRDDIDVRPLFSGGLYDTTSGTWTDYGDGWVIATYTPARDGWGSVAYIGAPVFWFEHDKIKTLIRHLLTEFGEQPLGS